MTRLEHDWFDAPLPPNIELGEGCWIYSSFAFLHFRSARPRGLRMGRRSGIYDGCCLDVGIDGEVEIGDQVALSCDVISTNGRVVIGDHVFIARGAILADSFAALPPDAPGGAAASASTPARPITIERDAWIGWRAIILGGAHIGEGAIIGAGAVVDFAVPPYAVILGNPARHVGWARPCSKT